MDLTEAQTETTKNDMSMDIDGAPEAERINDPDAEKVFADFEDELVSHCNRLEQVQNHLIQFNGMIHWSFYINQKLWPLMNMGIDFL